MLISPLMGPILGLGLAIGINDLALLKKSFKNFFLATLISILTATVYFWLTPYQGVQSELLARTSPNLYDVLIALFGGAAGITAYCAKDKGNVLPGVAIATALMPPLCTAGYGIANANLQFFAGAFFLYFINTVFITVATYIGVVALRFHKKEFASVRRRKVVRHIIVSVVVLTMIPAGYMTLGILRQSIFDRQLGVFSKENLRWEGTQIVTQRVMNDSVIRVVAVGREIPPEDIAKAQGVLKTFSHLKGYRLEVLQGAVSDSLFVSPDMKDLPATQAGRMQMIEQQSAALADLQARLDRYESFAKVSNEMREELKALYPAVVSLSLSPTVEVSTDTLPAKRFVLATVRTKPAATLSAGERRKLAAWLKARSKADSLRLIATTE